MLTCSQGILVLFCARACCHVLRVSFSDFVRACVTDILIVRVPVCGQISKYNTATPYLDLVGDAGIQSSALREKLAHLQVNQLGTFYVIVYIQYMVR